MDSLDSGFEEDEVDEGVGLELVSVEVELVLDSLDFEFGVEPLADDVDDDDRESVTYQPLPLKTMPTGWMTLRSVPPHWSQIVKGASEKL